MERAKTFQDMIKEGSVMATDTLLATGVAMVVIGIVAILAPLATGVLFDMIFGAILIGAGIVEFIDAFRGGTWQRSVLLGLAGIVTLAAGVLYIARPVVGLVVLTVVFLAYLVFVGAFRIVLAFQLPKGSPGKGWGFVSGVVSLVLAYLAIAQMPNISLWLIGTFIGVSLIFAGIARIALARGFRKATGLLGAPPPAERGAHA
jgi:aquaporin Z